MAKGFFAGIFIDWLSSQFHLWYESWETQLFDVMVVHFFFFFLSQFSCRHLVEWIVRGNENSVSEYVAFNFTPILKFAYFL